MMWVFDEDIGMNCREVTFVPGLYKIFDEILGKYCLLLSPFAKCLEIEDYRYAYTGINTKFCL